jgi:hypothetical protein
VSALSDMMSSWSDKSPPSVQENSESRLPVAYSSGEEVVRDSNLSSAAEYKVLFDISSASLSSPRPPFVTGGGLEGGRTTAWLVLRCNCSTRARY